MVWECFVWLCIYMLTGAVQWLSGMWCCWYMCLNVLWERVPEKGRAIEKGIPVTGSACLWEKELEWFAATATSCCVCDRKKQLTKWLWAAV